MEFNLQNFQELINKCDDNDIIRILFSENSENNKTNIISKIDIFNNNKINEIIKNISKKIISNEFTRDIYYSQIRDNDIIYTEEYDLCETFIKNNYNIILTKYNYIIQDIKSFPKLHQYHLNEKIKRDTYIIDNISLIIENNKLFIEFKKNDKIDNIFKIIEMII